MNQAKLAVLNHSEPLWGEKIGKVANQAQLAIQSHSEPLQWEKIGKVASQNVTLTQNLAFSFVVGGGGLHCLEPKCHVDPKLHLNLKN